MRRNALLSSLVVPVICAWLLTVDWGHGQDSPEPVKKPAAKKAVRGRLPAYFAAVVTREQRAEIYEIQAKFREQIAQLHEQIAELESSRDKQVDGVLSAEQLEEVNKKRAAAQQRRRARSRPSTEKPASPPTG